MYSIALGLTAEYKTSQNAADIEQLPNGTVYLFCTSIAF
jgi:hypothetical protein